MVNTIIVGSGFSGINVAIELLEEGDDSFLIIDRGPGFGGTWRDNTYPGAECDIQSHLYSFSFYPNPNWSKTYAPQPEILAYLESAAQKWGLERFAHFNEELVEAAYTEESAAWNVETTVASYNCRNLVLCTGHLADPKLPDVEGLEPFKGSVFHSARWNHELDLTGKSIGIVGTGASAIQVVPALAKEGHELTVFQRSAPYVIPRLDNVYTESDKRRFSLAPESARAFREFLFWSNENRFLQRMMVEPDLSRMADIAERHREQQLSGCPELLDLATPDYTIGCKRILLSNEWYPALRRENVTLVDGAVEAFTPRGVVDSNAVGHELDVVILCSGFEAQKLLIADRIRNGFNETLSETWASGSKAFGGMMVSGFPNMFMVNGPHVGLGAGSIISMIEVQAGYISKVIRYAYRKDRRAVQVSGRAEDEFFDHLQSRAEGTVWTSGGCSSWYLNPDNGQLSAIWPDQMNRYRARFSQLNPEELETI